MKHRQTFQTCPGLVACNQTVFSTKQNDVKGNFKIDTGCSCIVVMDTAQVLKSLVKVLTHTISD